MYPRLANPCHLFPNTLIVPLESLSPAVIKLTDCFSPHFTDEETALFRKLRNLLEVTVNQ
jgi:hypothetical protein